MPPSSEDVQEYSGNFINHLHATVEQVEAESRMEEMLARDPVLLLVGARAHLADKKLTAGDVQAWFRLGEKIEEIFAEPEDHGQKMIREHLDTWLQSRGGCFDS